MHRLCWSWTLLALATAPDIARAQVTLHPLPATPPKPPEEKGKERKKEPESARKEGWSPFLVVKSNVSLGESSNVIGRPDGTTVSLGATVSGRGVYRRGSHEWRTTLNAQVQYTRAPPIDAFVKSLDQLKVESSYAYDIPPVPWLAAYGMFAVETQLFLGEDVRADPVDYVIREANGAQTRERGNRLRLTREFSPTLFNEGAGLQFRLLDRKAAKVTFRVGGGAVQALVRGGLALIDAPRTPEVELLRLEDYVQVGPQLRLDAAGEINRVVDYALSVEALFPAYSSVQRGLSTAALTNLDLTFKLGVRLSSWAALNYILGVRRFPLLVDAFQIWNGLLVSFSYTLIR